MEEPRKHDLKELLKKSGYKFTDQRSAVLDVLIRHKDSHLSIDDIFNYVYEENPTSGCNGIPHTDTPGKGSAPWSSSIWMTASAVAELSRRMRTIDITILSAPTAVMFLKWKMTCWMRWRSRYSRKTVFL